MSRGHSIAMMPLSSMLDCNLILVIMLQHEGIIMSTRCSGVTNSVVCIPDVVACDFQECIVACQVALGRDPPLLSIVCCDA